MAQLGMLLAVVGTLLNHEIVSFTWIVLGLGIGTVIGAAMAVWIPMTKLPERIALSHAFGGLATALVGFSEFYRHLQQNQPMVFLKRSTLNFEVFLGSLTFTGSLMAFGKLQGILRGEPIQFKGQKAFTLSLIALGIGLLIYSSVWNGDLVLFSSILAIAFGLGIFLVLPIGGGDMPVVICLLNAYAGLAASATGFAIENHVLVVTGALDGGSGLVLAFLMSKAMNRSFSNVLFGGVGASTSQSGVTTSEKSTHTPVKEGTLEDVSDILSMARSVIIVPGYGMAVSQAQYAVNELAKTLKANGASVKYAIHPVAGRMPGHMNVLLAEANIPYEDLFELEEINGEFTGTDVALVVGANDVVNPAARTRQSSPIYGMPILQAEKAKTVLFLKRGLNTGFSGVENELFYRENTIMVFGDAKKTLLGISSLLEGELNPSANQVRLSEPQ